MAITPSIDEMESTLSEIRSNFKEIRTVDFAGKGRVKNFSVYTSKRTKHTVINFTLEDNVVVSREVPENESLQYISVFEQGTALYVWYDDKKMVQQYQVFKEYSH